MRKRRILITLFFVVVFAGIGLYFWFTRDIEAEDNKLSIPDTISDRIYLIDSEQSTLNFLIESDIDDIAGSFDIIGHRFEFVADEALGEWRVILVLDIDGTSIDTGSGVYDFLIETGFDVAHHPIGRFIGETETTISELEGVHELNFIGQLELRGVIQDYTVIATINIEGDILTGSAATQIDVRDFGVDFPSAIASNILEANISVVANESDEPIDPPDQTPLPSAEPTE